MTAKKHSDDWPDRIGLPMLKEALAKLEFVEGCLNQEIPAQLDAHFHALRAVEQTRKAIKELEAP